MNTIYNYVESVFVNLPRTPQMEELKEEMLRNMEDKYHDLKESGVSENEAIGTVLSDFGNIDEILEEYEIQQEEETVDSDVVVMNDEDVEAYIMHRQKYSFAMAIGVFLSILAVPIYLLTDSVFQRVFSASNAADFLSIALMLLTIAVAVGIFIIFGMRESAYPFDKKILQIDKATYARLKREFDSFKQRFSYAIASGVVLCILGVVVLMLSFMFLGEDHIISVVFLMSFIATGVFMFVYYGIQNDTYEKLLTVGSHTRVKVKTNNLTETVASIVFPVATLYYLYQGFFNGAWDTAWVVFPIVGIGFGIFAAIAEGIMNIQSKK